MMLAMLSKTCQTRGNQLFQLMMLAYANKNKHNFGHILPLKQKIPKKYLISMNFNEWKGLITHLRYSWSRQIDHCWQTSSQIVIKLLIGFYD